MSVENYNAPIDPAIVEKLLGDGYSVGEVAVTLGFTDRATLYLRRKKDPELKAAMQRGLAANVERRRLIDEQKPSDTANALIDLLQELQSEFRALRADFIREEQTA